MCGILPGQLLNWSTGYWRLSLYDDRLSAIALERDQHEHEDTDHAEEYADDDPEPTQVRGSRTSIVDRSHGNLVQAEWE